MFYKGLIWFSKYCYLIIAFTKASDIKSRYGANMKKVIFIVTCIAIFVMAVNATGIEHGQSRYAGSSACQPCHTDAYNSWKSSKHASIFKPAQDTPLLCNGCHTTGMYDPEQTSKEDDVGCEACHGPGGNHITNGGDINKIVSSNSADICGRCHSGNQSDNGGRWMTGYRPGMRLSDIAGLKLITVDPEELPPPVADIHPSLTYNMWLASGHSRPPSRKIQIGGKDWTGPISCVACHNPHYSDNPSQLAMKPEKLCTACHFQESVLRGRGAKGIEETRGLHTPIPCIACHMTEGNHLMKVLRPDNPALAEGRTDSCSACHDDRDRKTRARQIRDWEAWYKEAMDPIQADLKIVEIALEKNPDLLNAELKARLDDIKANLSIIINDGSGGVHNLDYALEIMALAKKNLAEMKKAIQ
jgi:predicted CXXCH cytochrome family protein